MLASSTPWRSLAPLGEDGEEKRREEKKREGEKRVKGRRGERGHTATTSRI